MMKIYKKNQMLEYLACSHLLTSGILLIVVVFVEHLKLNYLIRVNRFNEVEETGQLKHYKL